MQEKSKYPKNELSWVFTERVTNDDHDNKCDIDLYERTVL